MANVKISQLPSADTPLAGTEEVPVVQGGVTKKTTVDDIAAAAGAVTDVTATSPLSSTGGATPDISIPAANGSTSGYLTSTDWNTFNNKQPAGDYVTGPASATDNAITRFDSTTGKLVQNSGVTLNDNNELGNVNDIAFDTTPGTVPTAPGSLYWDAADNNQTLSLVMAGGNAVQQIGEEIYYRVKASAAITNGQSVMVTGAVGASGGLLAAPASGLTANNGEHLIGVATEDIALNGWGYVTQFGLVRNIDTTGASVGETWVDGDTLYYNPSYTGGLTKSVPVAPTALVEVAEVVHAHASSGSLFIRITLFPRLNQLANVYAPSPADNELIKWSSSASRWETTPIKTVNSVSLIGSGNVSTGDIVGPASATDNAVARFDGTTGKLIQNSAVTIDDSGNVTLSAGTANGVAYLDGSKVLTTGSALTFDGTSLGVGGVPTIQGELNVFKTGSAPTLYVQGDTGNSTTQGIIRIGGSLGRAASIQGFREGSSNLQALRFYSYNSADQLNYEITGAGNSIWSVGGSEQMRLTSTGLGIGTSSPAANLEVLRGSEGEYLRVGGDNASNARALRFTSSTSGASNGALHTINAASAEGVIALATAGTERLRITSSGNVGIGTSSPVVKLHVAGRLRVVEDTSIADLGSSAAGVYLYNRSNSALTFGTNDTERLRLDSSGNLGLGVTPSAWGSSQRALDIGYSGAIKSSTGTSSVVSLTNNAYYTTAWTYKVTGQAAALYDLRDTGEHRWYTAPSGTAGNTISFTQAMTLDASGNLGIGTSSPASNGSTFATLSLNGSNGGAQHFMTANSTVMQLYNDANAFYLNANSGKLTIFQTGGSERARIDSSGNLLVGTSSATGDASNTKRLVGGIFQTARGSGITGANGTAVTIFTISNYQDSQAWLVSADVSGQSTQAYACVYIVFSNYSGSLAATQLLKGSLGAISVSGQNVRYAQSSGGTQTSICWSAIRIM